MKTYQKIGLVSLVLTLMSCNKPIEKDEYEKNELGDTYSGITYKDKRDPSSIAIFDDYGGNNRLDALTYVNRKTDKEFRYVLVESDEEAERRNNSLGGFNMYGQFFSNDERCVARDSEKGRGLQKRFDNIRNDYEKQ